MIQWHPFFAELLRPLVEKSYDMQLDLPVGDAPRLADIVLLLRRRPAASTPFRGLWQHLTIWNVLEYKGPKTSPRRDALDLLVELGLGIHRRLNEERAKQRQPLVGNEGVSLWYLVHRLGRRYLRAAEAHLGTLEALGPGIWRSRVLGRLVFLVSGVHLPVERDSLPLHTLGSQTPETELAVARLVGKEPPLWELYSPWVATYHEQAVEEFEAMARATKPHFKANLEPLIRWLGIDEVIRQVGADRVAQRLGAKGMIEHLGREKVLAELGPEKVLAELGPEKALAEFGVEGLFAVMSPAQRRKMKQYLEK